MAIQPNHKGRKRVIFYDTHQIATPSAYSSNLNTAQQELLRFHETYAHAEMKEIQQQIKNCDTKANIQVATFQIPKCLSCYQKRQENITQTKSRIHQRRRHSTRI
jgi:hypothetical protein